MGFNVTVFWYSLELLFEMVYFHLNRAIFPNEIIEMHVKIEVRSLTPFIYK